MAQSALLPPDLLAISAKVFHALRTRNETVCVAETAAAGLISAALLSTPGASTIYKGGLTLYTLDSRIAFAGWTEETKSSYRGPSEDVVKGLSENVREKLGASYCVCESGTAGPGGGGTRNRRPGYVALAVAREGGETVTAERETGLGGDRQANMARFAVLALELLLETIEGKAHPATIDGNGPNETRAALS